MLTPPMMYMAAEERLAAAHEEVCTAAPATTADDGAKAIAAAELATWEAGLKKVASVGCTLEVGEAPRGSKKEEALAHSVL